MAELEGSLQRHPSIHTVAPNRNSGLSLAMQQPSPAARRLTARCVVGGFAYGEGSHLVGALLIGLFDEDGKFYPVGTTSDITSSDRRRLTHRLEQRRSGRCSYHFDGSPVREPLLSGWMSVKPEFVVEVEYSHFIDGRFRKEIRIVRRCPDDSPVFCTFARIHAELSGQG